MEPGIDTGEVDKNEKHHYNTIAWQWRLHQFSSLNVRHPAVTKSMIVIQE